MKFNKKAKIHPAIAIFGFIITFIIILASWVSIVSWFDGLGDKASKIDLETFLTESKSVHEIVVDQGGNYSTSEATYLKPLSYIIGEIPQAIIDGSSDIGAIIIIVLVFVILVLMMGDIISLFGTFSNDWIGWIIGTALAIIAANFKVVMLFAASGFLLVSGVGVLSVLLGVLVPFLVYIVVHFLFLGNLGSWVRGKKSGRAFKDSMNDLDQGIQGAKQFGKSVRKPTE